MPFRAGIASIPLSPLPCSKYILTPFVKAYGSETTAHRGGQEGFGISLSKIGGSSRFHFFFYFATLPHTLFISPEKSLDLVPEILVNNVKRWCKQQDNTCGK